MPEDELKVVEDQRPLTPTPLSAAGSLGFEATAPGAALLCSFFLKQSKHARQQSKPKTRIRDTWEKHRPPSVLCVRYSNQEDLTMTRFLYLTTALSALIALSAPAAQAAIAINGPALDGRQAALPDGLRIVGAPVEEVRGSQLQGPALDGRQVALPDGLRIVGTPVEEVRAIAINGPALDGRQVVLPDGLRIVGAPLERIPELPRED
jgi:hypothetical protein